MRFHDHYVVAGFSAPDTESPEEARVFKGVYAPVEASRHMAKRGMVVMTYGPFANDVIANSVRDALFASV